MRGATCTSRQRTCRTVAHPSPSAPISLRASPLTLCDKPLRIKPHAHNDARSTSTYAARLACRRRRATACAVEGVAAPSRRFSISCDYTCKHSLSISARCSGAPVCHTFSAETDTKTASPSPVISAPHKSLPNSPTPALPPSYLSSMMSRTTVPVAGRTVEYRTGCFFSITPTLPPVTGVASCGMCPM